jgi:hypothetical protein
MREKREERELQQNVYTFIYLPIALQPLWILAAFSVS